MAVFASRSRTGQAKRGTSERPVQAVRRGTPEPAVRSSLRASLQQLYALKTTPDVFAEEATRLISKASAARATVLLVYEARQDRMHLAAADGLESDAEQVLGTDATHGSWDIPLRALRAKRINVIESAHTNPFVPKPLVAINPRQLTIAVIPFYHHSTPVGVAVLFSPTARGFPDGMLQSVSQALRVCAAALAEMPVTQPQRAEEEARPQPTLLRGVATLKAELTRLARALEEADRQRAAEAAERITAESFLKAQRERVAGLEKELAALREEQTQHAAVASNLQQAQTDIVEARAAAEAGRSEISRLHTELTEARKELKKQQGVAQELATASDDLQHRLDETQALIVEREDTVRQLGQRLKELSARSKEADRLETHVAEAKKSSIELQDKIARLGKELEKAQKDLAQTRSERERAGSDLEKASAELATQSQRVQELSARAAEAEAGLAELETTREKLAAVQAKAGELEEQRSTLQAELKTLQAASEQGTKQWSAKAQEVSQQLEATVAERDRLATELESLRKETAAREQELRHKVEGEEAELSRLGKQLQELEKTREERDRLLGQIEELRGELTGVREQVGTLDSRIEQLSSVNSRLIAERRELHARVESLTRGEKTLEEEKQAAINAAQQRVTELESALSRMAKTLATTRTGATEDLTKMREELAGMESARQKAESRLAQARSELEARQKELGTVAEEREALRAKLESSRSELKQLNERIAKSQTEAGQIEKQRAETSRTADELRQRLEKASRERQALEEKLEATRRELTAKAEARIESAEGARKKVEEKLAEEQSAREREAATLREQVTRVREELTSQLQEMMQRHQEADAERERLAQALAEKDLILQALEERLSEEGLAEAEAVVVAQGGEDIEPVLEAGDESMLVIDRSGGDEEEAAAAKSAKATPQPEGPTNQIIVVDTSTDGASPAAQLQEGGFNVTPVAADGDLCAHLAGQRPACAVVNVGAPGAWATVRKLCAEQKSAIPPLLAYALGPGAKTGFWFGVVNFCLLPVADSVTELLQRMMPKARRVIAMSSDLDVMSDVREELNKSRISTAVVLDGRQALDLVPTVRPEVAVLHLSPTSTDVFRAIAGLRGTEAGRDIPVLFLLDEEAQPREEAFLSAGVRMLSGRGNLKADELIGTLKESLAPYR